MTIRALALSLAALSLQAAEVAFTGASGLTGPARHGYNKLASALEARGHKTAAASAAAYFVRIGCPPGMAAQGPQSLAIRRGRYQGKPAIDVCAGGPRGLMYALLDIAERVSWTTADDPFAKVRETRESPFLEERGISIYTMQRAYFESRLFDEDHWRRYFDLLAASRINTFTVIFGYENGGFMAPLYPYFFDVPGFDTVRLIGITAQQQSKNTAAFRALIRIAHERGIDVIPAVWDHIYRGGVQGGGIAGASASVGKDVPGLVSGVTAANLAAYTQAALREFVKTFPDIDGIEFRMHSESGLKPEEMAGFWHGVFGMLAKAKPGLRVTLRAKELPDAIIDDALRQGLRARVETKYWMEQMGLPYHPTHVNRENQHDRRHGYADLLHYPQRYRVHWRLWSGGTTRLLLWADPEYVRRFAASARLYDGNSFDVNEMLATKMLGEPHDTQPFAIHTPPYRFYGYEFERYWHFYQLWGRLSYNPQTPPEVWEEEFRRRFGAAGESLMRGLHAAGGILPRIVAASYRYQLFPTTRGWAEMMRQGDLPQFAAAEGTDLEQFQNPRDAAAAKPTSMRTPDQTSAWFRATADSVLRHAREAEAAGEPSKEARTILTDLRILAGLAQFHAARLHAAVEFHRAPKNAAAHEHEAVDAWKRMVDAAGDVYSPDLAFGVHRVGFPRHWREELTKLEEGLSKLPPAASKSELTPPQALTRILLASPKLARPGQDVSISAKPLNAAAVKSMRLRYRHLTQYEDYESVEMQPDSTGAYTARIPASFIQPKWDLMFFIELHGPQGAGQNFPDLDIEAPYVIIPVERPIQKGKP